MFALTLYIWLHNLRTKPSKQQEMGLANVKQLQNLHKMSVGNFQIICKRICFSKYYTWLCWCINMKTFWMEYSLLTPIWLILCLPPFHCSFKCTHYKDGMCVYGTMIKFSLDATWCYPSVFRTTSNCTDEHVLEMASDKEPLCNILEEYDSSAVVGSTTSTHKELDDLHIIQEMTRNSPNVFVNNPPIGKAHSLANL